MGESGSGKSTLLAILAGLDDGSSGEVSLEGQPLHNMDEEARAKLRAKHEGFVFQSFMLIPTLNALENVELPAQLRGESIAESSNGAKAMLEQLGLGKRLDNLPAQLSGAAVNSNEWRWHEPLMVDLMCCLPTNPPATLTARRAIKLPTCCFPSTVSMAPR